MEAKIRILNNIRNIEHHLRQNVDDVFKMRSISLIYLCPPLIPYFCPSVGLLFIAIDN